ncbi:hypothetical protein [Halorubrum lipolyticum]|uniref:Uncharacterized protein n=1 Tax=Halorubrum lipolyticum DSM 21995 TaxID=1227482 RepID=M0P1B8_9EURY|nr:hypothetical protein [Halorubrum lipolyticum]EMA63876.1 hypothetical protein C469_01954 [Halorubrum lipolyticum DSM 21995]
MRRRDDPIERRRPTNRRRYPTNRRRQSSDRERSRPPRGSGRSRSGLASRSAASPLAVPGATLVALTAVTALAVARAARWPIREWSLALAALVAVGGCLLGTVGVAHVAAGLAARRVGAGR